MSGLINSRGAAGCLFCRLLAFLLFCWFTAGPAGPAVGLAEGSDIRYSIFDIRDSTFDIRYSGSDACFSASVGVMFHEIGCSTARLTEHPDRLEQAIILLVAATAVDPPAEYVLADLIDLACRHRRADYSELVYKALADYVIGPATGRDRGSDLEVLREGISYILERLDSREQREAALEKMLAELGGKDKRLDSELATELGLLAAEKADANSAKAYFRQAYNDNKYNKLAFAKLAELAPEQVGPAMKLEHLRWALDENPLALESALAFAQFAEKLQLYETAAGGYQYCADLFSYLHEPPHPRASLPASIYLRWMLCCYNTRRSSHKCLQIASEVRKNGNFDLLLEAIAGKAAAKIGNRQYAEQLLQAAAEKAEKLAEYEPQTANVEQLAWFYCFAAPDADKALYWAHKAYADDSCSAIKASILAYSFVMKGQIDLAKLLIDNYQRTQIADLTLAQIQLARGQQDLAIENLKSAIARDPGTLAAERAKQILAQQGREYIPPVDTGVVLAELANKLRRAIVPKFVRPEKTISVQLKLRGGKFSYGSKFEAAVEIKNSSAQPLVISDDGLIKGNIRIDANVSGDIDEKIPNLVSFKTQPSLPIERDRSISIPVRLVTGRLKQILLAHPQASLDIEFTAFIDPVVNSQGHLTNRLRAIKPARAVAKCPGVELSSKYLENRLNSLSRGKQGQKIQTTKLFAGLLMEQQQLANRQPLYKLAHAPWMPDLLKTALMYNLANDDWVVKVHTLADLLSVQLDYKLMEAVADNLADSRWPVRLMTIFLLAKSQSSRFQEVLNWTAEYDSNELVRQMAVALGGKEPYQ